MMIPVWCFALLLTCELQGTAAKQKHHLVGGSLCAKDKQCKSNHCSQSFSSQFQEGVCALESMKFPGMVGEGGYCTIDAQCASNYCTSVDGVRFCTTESAEKGKIGADGFCRRHSECYSGFCGLLPENLAISLCSADSATKGKVGTGGLCELDSDCFSNYCIKLNGTRLHNHCSVDSNQAGFVGGGGPCRKSGECHSKRCETGYWGSIIISVCAVASPKVGRIGAGGACSKDEECYSRYCISEVLTGTSFCAAFAENKRKLPGGSPCRHNGDCFSEVCTRMNNKINVCSKDSHSAKVGGGGACQKHKQCFSSHCSDHLAQYGDNYFSSKSAPTGVIQVCARDSPAQGHIGGGGNCAKSRDCYSKCCMKIFNAKGHLEGRCSANAVTIDSKTKEVLVAHRKVADTAPCKVNSHCLSKFCWTSTMPVSYCAKGSEVEKSKVGGGGECMKNSDCASDLCALIGIEDPEKLRRLCARESKISGLVGSGGPCFNDSMCYSGYCVPTLLQLPNGSPVGTSFCATDGEIKGKVAPGGPCRRNNDCDTHSCTFITLQNTHGVPQELLIANGRSICT